MTARPRARGPGRVVSWAGGTLALVMLTGAMLAFRDHLDKSHVALLYLLLVLGASATGGRALGITTASVSFVLFDFLFLEPYHTLTVANPLDWLVLGAFFLTSLVATELLDRERRHAELADRRTMELDRLASLGAETLNAARADDALAAIAEVIRHALHVDRCELFVREEDGARRVALAETVGASSGVDHVNEHGSLPRYVIDEGAAAVERPDGTVHLLDRALQAIGDHETNGILSLAVPLSVRGLTVGALRVVSAEPFALTEDNRREVEGLSYYAALGIERRRLEYAAQDAEALRRSDRVKDALLASVSHDLRTPLTTIRGVAHEIRTGGDPSMAAQIEEDVDRLNLFVADLLDLSQLKAGALRTRLELNTVDELVGAALQRSQHALEGHPVVVDLGSWDLLVGRFDFSHASRILSNLLENAAKYAPSGTPIELTASRIDERIRIQVSDRGMGIAPADRERIFEPFVRAGGAGGVRGAGLGLSIARQLAEAQGGRLEYEPREGGGSTFCFDFPAAEVVGS